DRFGCLQHCTRTGVAFQVRKLLGVVDVGFCHRPGSRHRPAGCCAALAASLTTLDSCGARGLTRTPRACNVGFSHPVKLRKEQHACCCVRVRRDRPRDGGLVTYVILVGLIVLAVFMLLLLGLLASEGTEYGPAEENESSGVL